MHKRIALNSLKRPLTLVSLGLFAALTLSAQGNPAYREYQEHRVYDVYAYSEYSNVGHRSLYRGDHENRRYRAPRHRRAPLHRVYDGFRLIANSGGHGNRRPYVSRRRHR